MVFWPAEHKTALVDYMRDDSGSHAQVAVLLNEKFGTAYSRNAVIGQCSRIGMVTKRPPKGKRVPRKVTRSEKPKPTPPPEPLRCVEVDPLGLTLQQLTDETCKWPYGDNAPFVFCGHEVFVGSWCGAHYFLAHRNGG